jgi:hypothetical protein
MQQGGSTLHILIIMNKYEMQKQVMRTLYMLSDCGNNVRPKPKSAPHSSLRFLTNNSYENVKILMNFLKKITLYQK